MPQRKFPLISLIFFSCVLGHFVHHLEGQIIEMHGDPRDPDSYSCAVSGLKGMGSDCGTKYDEMVFTAEILSIEPAPDGEFHLTLRPKTVFKGSPAVGMQILTAQHRCLPPMKTGDSWLFSLYRDQVSKELLVNYGSHSGPESEESQRISFLGKLAALDGAGVVKGRAYSYRRSADGIEEQLAAVNHTIILSRLDAPQKLQTLTDKTGGFEFERVPAGMYDLDPNTDPGLWTMWSGKIDVEPHGCTDFDLDFQVDGQISGRLIFPGEVDPSEWEVTATPADDSQLDSASAWTDESGRFVLHGLGPGKYLVKFAKTEMRKGPNLRVDLFAPGTQNSANAQVIELDKGTRLEGIELIVPGSVVK